ncbi:MAG: hypothetical protein J6C46_05580 [Clostridia bacterium]|nr:hypothetical protein [Clostridia bacterium]
MSYSEINIDDKLALAEAYRVYEMLNGSEQEKIPSEFVDLLLTHGDLSLIGPLDSQKSLEEQNISKYGKYLIMYMCTFQ